MSSDWDYMVALSRKYREQPEGIDPEYWAAWMDHRGDGSTIFRAHEGVIMNQTRAKVTEEGVDPQHAFELAQVEANRQADLVSEILEFRREKYLVKKELD